MIFSPYPRCIGSFILFRAISMPHGCRSHIDVGTLRPSAPGYAGACEGRLTGHRHSGIRVLSHAPLLPEGSPHARIAEPCPVVQGDLGYGSTAGLSAAASSSA